MINRPSFSSPFGASGPRPPLLISSEIYRQSSFGAQHPLGISRASSAQDLLRALGQVRDDRYCDSPQASFEQLLRFHQPDYLQALQAGERDPRNLDEAARDRYRLGRDSNPIHRLMYSRPATACGGSLLAADLLASGAETTLYNMGGGTHHGRPDRAAGFCYMNDPVLCILRLWDQGIGRVAYVDLDAHHPDGVQDALSADPRLLMLSVHEERRWPMTGGLGDRGGGSARNLPVPAGFNDSEMGFIVARCLVPLVTAYQPEILIVQCGADALEEDPLSRLSLSNNALWDAIKTLKPLASRFLVLGGGGYNPWSVTRAWAGVWLALNDVSPPVILPLEAEAVLRQLSWNRSAGRNPPSHWFTTLMDQPRPGPISETVRQAVASVMNDA